MKHLDHFTNFLNDTVNLNQSRIDLLEERVKTIKSFIRASTYEPKIKEFSQQGSWAHKTIIKPKKDKEFDADVLIVIESVDEWDASQYINDLYTIFHDNGTYKDMVSRGSRCVTLDYSGDFHLDLVPCVRTEDPFCTTFHVCNRNSNSFEETDSKGYTAWLQARNTIVKGNNLRKTIKLLKYMRDIKGNFTAKSILLTTLVGYRVNPLDGALTSDYFPDLPTSLKTLIGDLDKFLQDNPTMPDIRNPMLPHETFNRHWDQTKYANFRDKINLYRDRVDQAFEETNANDSIRKWRLIFGNDFAKGVEVKEAKAIVSNVLGDKSKSLTDLFEAIEKYGLELLSRVPRNLSWVALPTWSKAQRMLPVVITAAEYANRDSQEARSFVSGQSIRPNRSIKFHVGLSTGLPAPYKVKYQVVNTGEEAADAEGLRGEISDGSTADHWEDTQYVGVHWIQFFIIDGQSGVCVAESERFFVVVR